MRYPLRIALLSGVLLSQIGEFSFVLASQGFENKIISNEIYTGGLHPGTLGSDGEIK
jgi:CPA2 family monovalent cation:H+ antiporter-2